MCLTIPKKVLSIKKDKVVVREESGKQQEVATLIKVEKGDWILTQSGMIIDKITQKQAKEINKLIKNPVSRD